MNRHLSEEQFADWVVGERDPDAEQHARECAECATELERMERALLLFRESGERWSAYWRGAVPVSGVRRQSRLALAGVLAGLVLAGVLLLRPPSPPSRREQPFVAIPYVVPPAPYERTSVVRMDVPVAALPAAGIMAPIADVSGTVAADVLVGQDGRVLAIRLVSPF